MKIAFDAKRAFNNPAGLGNYSRLLVNALMRDFPENEYLLCTPKVKGQFFNELNGNFKMILPDTRLQKSLSSFWRPYNITNQLDHEGVNIYHGLSNELPFNIHHSHIKSVVTIHDVIFLKHTEQYPFIDRQIYDLKTKYAVKHAYKVVAVSNETKQDLIHFYKVPADKIEVIYQSVNERFYKPVSEEAKLATKKKYRLPERYILNVGSFFPRKNHKILLNAFARIKNQIAEDLILIGSQGNKDEVENLIKQKQLQDRIKIISTATNEDMPAIYQSANLFVFPSLFEGFGIPVLEALFSKVPVITTKGGCFEEAGGKESLYIDSSSAEELAASILKVLNDSSVQYKMKERGYNHALTMTDKIFAEKTMAVYRSL